VERYGGGPITTIEHVGSTAVPGLAAKPIVDVLVGVGTLSDARAPFVKALENLGYRYMAEYETWLPREMLFRRGVPGAWTHHVHVMEPTSPRGQEFVLVRDYLRGHADSARAYGSLKAALAVLFGDDITGFRGAKGPFLQEVLAKARAEWKKRLAHT
jgi:GrpB-like predicted nucleotidyltransferase (UPF0157 family)